MAAVGLHVRGAACEDSIAQRAGRLPYRPFPRSICPTCEDTLAQPGANGMATITLPSRHPSCEDSLTQRPVDDTKPTALQPPTSSASPNISRNRRIAGDVQSNISISPRQAAIPRDTEIPRPAHSATDSPKTAKSSRFQVCGNQTDYTQSLNISPEHPVPRRFSEKHPDILSFAAPRERY